MSIFPSFDNRTLLSCELLLAVAFAIAFLAIRRAHPDLRGVGSIASGFLLGIPGLVLLLSQGTVHPLFSVVVANSLIFISFILFCDGILTLLGSNRASVPFWLSTLFSVTVIFYFTQVHDAIVPRLIVISFNLVFIRSLLAVELFRLAKGRNMVRIFASSMTFFAIVSLGWAVVALIQGAPRDLMQREHVQTFSLVMTIFSSCLTGLFSLSICHDQVLSLVRAESQLDPLSGTLNRRGIEYKLDIELKRIERGGPPLSIALIDIDYFKTINDTEGHAAGDNALRDVATAISAKLRAYDIFGRFGGDEFLLLLPQTSCVGAAIVAERIGDAVRSFSSIRNGPALTISVGVSEAILGDYSTSLLARADKALYQAKNAGRNCTRAVLHNTDNAHDSASQQLINALLPSNEPDLIVS
jgi:diguanylate cyclase (GGDEF)-like protein